MPGSVLASSARTPIGRLSGALAPLSAVELGGIAIAAALERAGLQPNDVDRVILGQVLQAGQGQNPARQAAAKGGLPMSVPALTVNSVCLSGLHAIQLADQLIQAGEAEVVVAGGMESMTGAPHLLPGARAGYRLGDATVVDATIHDGLWCAFDGVHMGAGTEAYTRALGIPQEVQDEWAATSHERAALAGKEGRFAEEIVPVTVPQRKGDPLTVKADEGVRPDTTAEGLARLKPAFSKDGTITAGNASQISDGAAAVVLVSAAKAGQMGMQDRPELVGFGTVAGPDPSLLTQPSRAIRRAVDAVGVGLGDVDLFEINEAFAAVVAASMADLGVDDDIVNVNGGAIALGHPIGMSGARLVITLSEELKRSGGRLGAAALCGGGGQGAAALLRVRG